MDIEFHGANCITIGNKNVRLVFDDNLTALGAKTVARESDVALFTGIHGKAASLPKLVIDSPGDYEVAGVSVQGIPARAHLDEKGTKNATIYKVIADDLRILLMGHVYPEVSESQLEQFGTIDLLIIPVGGNGYTLDPVGALQLMKKVEPKSVIVTHYDDSALNFEVPQQSLEDALKVLSLEPSQTTKKLRIKSDNFIEGTLDLIVLEKS